MKLRLKDNSIRIRLNRREVAELLDRGTIGATILFAFGQELSYRVAAGGAGPMARFESGEITLSFPPGAIQEWGQGDAISLGMIQETFGTPLQILLEKDLACLKAHPGKYDPDAYVNPLAGKVTCR